jgi:hypothetical protein
MQVFDSDVAVSLTLEERYQAQRHWKALMFARSLQHPSEARQALKAAPPHIQKVVIVAIVELWQARLEPVPGQTPFDE